MNPHAKATMMGVHRGVRYEVGIYPTYSGVRWRIPTVDHLGRSTGHLQSSGAFYDDCPDHPEGAFTWAEASVKKAIDLNLDALEKVLNDS
jgi:hypothetical protein